MSKRLYVAYGSNLNFQQMRYRCPTAKLYGIGTIDDYELQFKGQPGRAFATIAPQKGASVPVAVWEIHPQDEQSLDHYEGFPSHYFKQDVPVKLEGKEVTAMVYIMNLRMQFALPSLQYYQTVYEGYNDCDLDTNTLNQAVGSSAKKFYSSAMSLFNQQSLFACEESEAEDEEDDFEDEGSEEEINEADPYYFLHGMHL